jgi:FkbM family methyltransferase
LESSRSQGKPLGLYLVGARGGNPPIELPPVFRRDCFYVFFDADSDALPKVRQANPELADVLPICLGDRDGTALFNINAHPGTSSLYSNTTDEFEFCHNTAGVDYIMRKVQETIERREVEIRRLDGLEIFKDDSYPRPDVLTLDVQGAELDVIRGGRELIQRETLAVITEVEFVPLYDRQPLFGDMIAELGSLGFVFAGFRPGISQAEPFRMPLGQRGRGFDAYCEAALFLRRPSTVASDRERLTRLAFISHAQGQIAFGFHCMEMLEGIGGLTPAGPDSPQYLAFLHALSSARKSMPQFFGTEWHDLNSFESAKDSHSVERRHLADAYQAARKAEAFQKAALQLPTIQMLLNKAYTPLEEVFRNFGFTHNADAIQICRRDEAYHLAKDLGFTVNEV